MSCITCATLGTENPGPGKSLCRGEAEETDISLGHARCRARKVPRMLQTRGRRYLAQLEDFGRLLKESGLLGLKGWETSLEEEAGELLQPQLKR